MTTQESNKLIAEFMDLPSIRAHEKGKENLYSWINEISGETILVAPSKMNFERSWDWLMPVVEKCYQENMNENLSSERKREDFDMLINDAILTINIEEVYDTVVQFIQWYNENKKQ